MGSTWRLFIFWEPFSTFLSWQVNTSSLLKSPILHLWYICLLLKANYSQESLFEHCVLIWYFSSERKLHKDWAFRLKRENFLITGPGQGQMSKKQKVISKAEFTLPPFLVKKTHSAERYKIVTKDWFYTLYSGTGDIVVSSVVCSDMSSLTCPVKRKLFLSNGVTSFTILLLWGSQFALVAVLLPRWRRWIFKLLRPGNWPHKEDGITCFCWVIHIF